MEKSYLVSTATPNINEMEAVTEYVTKAGALIQNAGGIIIKKVQISEIIEGENPPKIVMIAEFANDEAIRNLFSSEAYQTLIPIREKGFDSLALYIGK